MKAMSDQILKEIQTLHKILDDRYKDEFAHRENTEKQFTHILQRLDEMQPVLEVYRAGLTWSTGVIWLTKWFMKIVGGVGVLVGTIIALRELFKK